MNTQYILLLGVIAFASTALANPNFDFLVATVFRSTNSTKERLAESTLKFVAGALSSVLRSGGDHSCVSDFAFPVTITVFPTDERQRIHGFGGALSEATACTSSTARRRAIHSFAVKGLYPSFLIGRSARLLTCCTATKATVTPSVAFLWSVLAASACSSAPSSNRPGICSPHTEFVRLFIVIL